MATVVVGLGNPLLGDDGVGLAVAALLRKELAGSGVDVIEAYAGGLRLMEAVAGYARALIVDAVQTGSRPPGTVSVFALPDAAPARHTLCAHDGDLATVLALGRHLGLRLPQEIEILGVEAHDVETFGERLSPAVQAALPVAAAAVRRWLGRETPEPRESA